MRLASLLAFISLSLTPCVSQDAASPHSLSALPSAQQDCAVRAAVEVASADPSPFQLNSVPRKSVPRHAVDGHPVWQEPRDDKGQQGESRATPGREPGADEKDSSAAGSPVPEPSTWLLVITGLVGLFVSTCWRRRRVEPTQG